ncbi:Gfo/Idh/MocA family protein [Sciscionella marina]|uniref:Gfo/Idh/MocA family protein n=1 Tax=Sciscionella marina TaxID=508770 RepID=UPI00038242B1|nr:Gfo/Idh/MocA family oxidoreductase [Sciscionella marina]
MRFGIVGSGIRGRMYARSLREAPGVGVVAVCDLDQSSAQQLGEEFGVAAFTDHRQMLADTEPDAVIVATPDFAHRDVAVDSAKAGAHLLIEKPLATTREDIRAIHEAVAAAGVQCLVGFENRWNPAIRRLRELSAAGRFGEVLTQNILLSNTYYVPREMLSWAAKSSPAWFLMSHTVDAAAWVADKAITSVVARGSRGRLASLGIDTWDVIHALLTFADGTTANLTSTWVLPDSEPSIVDFKYQVVGTEAAVDVDLQDQSVRLAAEDYSWPGLLGGELDGRLQGPPTWMVQSFAARLLDGAPVGPGIADGAMVTDVVLAILESLETGAPTPVTPTLSGSGAVSHA